MFIKFVDIDWFVFVILTLVYPCVLSLDHMFIRKIWEKFQKSELSKFIPNFPLKHVITSTNLVFPETFGAFN